ncbi:MAG: family 20 glycosylhydrolase, partial [Pseudomonadales bacterium]
MPIESSTAVFHPALLPYPARIEAGTGTLRCGGNLQVEFTAARSDRLDRAVERFEAGLQRIGLSVAERDTVPWRLQIICAAAGAEFPQLGDAEAYQVSVGDDGVIVCAQCEWGVLHALTTLVQLIVGGRETAGSKVRNPQVPFCEIPCCEINDQPRFPWRGVLIDVARHFIGMDGLRRTVDGMALCKLNVLHLHLTDDQSFRFPTTQFPAVVSGEHFTVAELLELVCYAADRGIRVVPEIDMPGHTNCWIVAYPEWATDEARASRRFGVHQACLDPSNESVYAALATLLGEVTAIFPDRHLHIGGDEVSPDWWSQSARVQRFMADRGIPDIAALQAVFVARVAEISAGLGRTAVGWDEVLHDDLARSEERR